MKSFLYHIARTFYQREKGNLANIAFVFPNRRSGKFFQHYLAQVAGEQSLFSPAILTINSLMSELAQLHLVDKIELLFTLYEEYGPDRESFDKFVFWGEMLAGDFDDIDKYLVDASQLFANIKDLKDLDQPYLTPEQIAVIQQFWGTFNAMSSDNEKKKEFSSLWDVMYNLYRNVRSRLLEKGVGYEGMVFRQAAERARNHQLPPLHTLRTTRKCNRIVFIGFNAITPAEREVMRYYYNTRQGDFYWDNYAQTLMLDDGNRANYFLEQNVKDFPSKYDDIEGLHTITEVPEMTVLPVSSGVGQVKQAGVILQNLIDENCIDASNAINTAVVLPDEELLMPMIYSIPQDISSINITMGYSLKNTSVASLFEAIARLQKRVRWSGGKALYYHIEVAAILNHRLVIEYVGKSVVDAILATMKAKNMAYVTSDFLAQRENKLLALIFTPIVEAVSQGDTEAGPGVYLERILQCLLGEGEEAEEQSQVHIMTQLEHEYTYHYYNMVSRLNDVVSKHKNIPIHAHTYFALLGKLSFSVPFEGEPLSGLQVMGVLETRALDFENIIILSMNEGVFPKKRAANTFIPYNLRRGYNMATSEHQDSIYAYYFYRMIARAKRVYMLYDSRTDGLQSGEMSRFIYQLQYHYSNLIEGYGVKEVAVAHSVKVEKSPIVSVKKEGSVLSRLQQFLAGSDAPRALSASAVKTYINCPLQFYLQYVEDMQVEDEISEDVGGNVFGTIYHNVMADIYNDLKERFGVPSAEYRKVVNVTPQMLTDVLNDREGIMRLIERQFNIAFYRADKNATPPPLTGKNSIIGHMVYTYVVRTLEYDRDVLHAFTYYASEERLGGDLFLPAGDDKQVRFKAFIDRVDYVGESVRIVDYKTGNDAAEAKSVESLFGKDEKEDKIPGAIMQVLLYCKLYRMAHPTCTYNLKPLIYKVRKAFSDFVPTLKVQTELTGYDDVAEEYEKYLGEILKEMFDETIPFTQTQVSAHCTYCNFKTICKRS